MQGGKLSPIHGIERKGYLASTVPSGQYSERE